MPTFQDALAALRDNQPEAKYGLAFERLMVNYFQADPVLAATYDEVCRWGDWRYNGGKTDTGIDMVARRIEDGRWVAIQCKFYKETAFLDKGHLDSFFEASGRKITTENGKETFAQRLIISTTDRWSTNAEAMLEDQSIPVSRIGMASIAESPVDWDVVFPGSEMKINLSRRETFQPRPHQAEAIDKVLEGFTTHNRGKLIMACGTGKTFTSLRLAERVAEERDGKANILFLVPSISLLSQTLKEWVAQSEVELRPFAVCSDAKVSRKAEDIAPYELQVPVSTTGADIAERYSHGKRAKGLNVVFSTYQSLDAVHDAQGKGLDEFDLVICDEAHRTTGITAQGDEPSTFTRIHDKNYIAAAKRLYMTATPRLFDDNLKDKAEEVSAEVASMDDEAIYGPEFYRIGFGQAVEKGLLTDYKVVVMTVDEDVAAEAMARQDVFQGSNALNLTTAAAMIGTWNALAKRSGKLAESAEGFSTDDYSMRRAVAFAKDIKTSKEIARAFPTLIGNYRESLVDASALNDVSLHHIDLDIEAEHVDGSMNAMERESKLSWLKASVSDNETRILTNARCLSEGVDVPALDAVVFFNARNSMVDVVQSVGRVMRKAADKNLGYIILPVAVSPDVSPEVALNDNRRFKVVWQILNALRAHDDRFNAKVNSIQLDKDQAPELPLEIDRVVKPNVIEGDTPGDGEGDAEAFGDSKSVTQLALFSLEQWQEAMNVKLVKKVGSREYWDNWAEDVAGIAQAQITRINALLDNASPKTKKEFDRFVEGLRGNLNDSITEEDAVSLLSQHLITAPVFDALFKEHSFAEHNPVSKVMQRMVDVLADSKLESETASLDKFYESVRVRASEVTSASGKQQVVKELYEQFFRKAFKKQSEALGIVYTPVEIVDFILRAADDLSKEHFGKGLTDDDVHVLDPFTGTGTFIVRLLQSGLIEPEDLARKYANEIHATEIMLLAYYVAAVNIESTFNALQLERALREGKPEPDYVPFDGIALGDTFQTYEDGDALDFEVFKENNKALERQKSAPIHIIVGNPPYSAGQKTGNDNNQNLKYPSLDRRITETYAARSSATNKNRLYDSYLRAYRWATDRIGDQGIVAFVSNGGWIDSNSADGVRISLEKDFSEIYVFNLMGNMRNPDWKREGGQIFGSGSQTTITLFLGVKESGVSGCRIHYRSVGDFLSREEKLEIVKNSELLSLEWRDIVPNKEGDWLDCRSEEFDKWPVLADRTGVKRQYFRIQSGGLKTNRDAWCYNLKIDNLRRSIELLISTFDQAKREFNSVRTYDCAKKVSVVEAEQFISSRPDLRDSTLIAWTLELQNKLAVLQDISYDSSSEFYSLYRPFFKSHCYFNKDLNTGTYRLPALFPTKHHDNVGIYVLGLGAKKPFSVFGTSLIPDLNLYGSEGGKFFARWSWEPISPTEGELDLFSGAENSDASVGEAGEIIDGYRRVDNITDEIRAEYKKKLGPDVTSDDIFYFVYAQLHDPGYREKYRADLKKILPHIEVPTDRERFDFMVDCGRRLMDLHVNYESVEPYPVTVSVKKSADENDRETWRVSKMKWAKKKDPETGKNVNDVTKLIYNKAVTITDIPAEAEEYMLGSRSALGWLIDRYQVKKDKKSGIINDPNDWCDEVGNPRYIVDLIARVARVAVETNMIVNSMVEE
ncbi:DEAD/DEAH box helicase [Corynebacterium mendelii]|uniref:DEAD/DEAH box helicase n=1 Tax=Corynebacterium mendelii TaxID=2765362 RepID=A0A939E300_9CORY|nr:DEAD/DEAH box helicase [Corynebacterium mendelii]MBN9644746.1 DEAD/DEAH box helicase [Corynebacterium mendelii]